MDLLPWILEYPSWREKHHRPPGFRKSMSIFPDPRVSQPGWSRNCPSHSFPRHRGWNFCWIPLADLGNSALGPWLPDFSGIVFPMSIMTIFPSPSLIPLFLGGIPLEATRGHSHPEEHSAPAVSDFKGNLGMLGIPGAGNGTGEVQDPPGDSSVPRR